MRVPQRIGANVNHGTFKRTLAHTPRRTRACTRARTRVWSERRAAEPDTWLDWRERGKGWKLGLVFSSRLEANWFQMKIGRFKKPLMSFDLSFISPSSSSIFVFFVPRGQAGVKTHLKPPSLKYPQAHADHSPVIASHSPLTIAVFPASVRLAFSSVMLWRTPGLWRCCPPGRRWAGVPVPPTVFS